MATVPMNLSVPEELADRLRDLARTGRIPNVSGFVSEAVREHLDRTGRPPFDAEAYVSQHFAAPDADANAWGADVVAAIRAEADA